MELEEIKRLYNAMNENGMSELSLKIGSDEKIRLKLNDLNTMRISEQQIKPEEENEDVSQVIEENNLYEIQSDKVGLLEFDGVGIKQGDKIKKNDILGYVAGIGSKDYIKSPCNGKIVSIETPYGTIVDYGKVLFVVEVEE